MSEDVVHDRKAAQFSMVVEGHRCVLDYRRDGSVLSLDSVRVPKAVGGRGIAGKLTRHALDWARAHDLSIRPVCPYVSTWIQRHSSYADLVV